MESDAMAQGGRGKALPVWAVRTASPRSMNTLRQIGWVELDGGTRDPFTLG
jgi:hypothetical protein